MELGPLLKNCVKNMVNMCIPNSLLITAGIFLTGNNYDKLALFCQFLGLELILKATYNIMQTHYIIPEVQRYWEQMKNEIWDSYLVYQFFFVVMAEMTPQDLALKYCMYVMMEQYFDIIVDLEVVEKRQTGGVSTTMEVFGLEQILISKVVEASSAMIVLVRTMKGNVRCLFIHLRCLLMFKS